MKKKLIEVALPLEVINAESVREKSIRHGHPSTLHLWWARRPLATARAVIWSSLVDDPSSRPEEFPTKQLQDIERLRLFGILERLVKWENSNNQDVLDEAKAEIMKSTDSNPPALFDPFAGGGAIPLEAQRLGLEAHASDLNPVAVMINKAMIEIPPKYSDQVPINPDSRREIHEWQGADGLAADVQYYGEWMKKRAFERIGNLYPTVKDGQGQEFTVIAWIWARTVACPNPACGCEMPLVRSFKLSNKKNNEAYVNPVVVGSFVKYEVKDGKGAPGGTVNRKGAKCICCGFPVSFEYLREESRHGRMGSQLIAIVAEGRSGRRYFSANAEHIQVAKILKPEEYPQGELAHYPGHLNTKIYGLDTFDKLFTNRQLTTLTVFCDLVEEARKQIIADNGSEEYANSISVYLAFLINRMADRGSTICSWDVGYVKIRNTFGRQAIPMTWDYAEANPFSNSTGSFSSMIMWIYKVLIELPAKGSGIVRQHDAQSDIRLRNIMVSTDPPYYDNIGYADLSDFFYIWLRRILKDIFPDLFKTILVPKVEELVATPYRFGGNKEHANEFFEKGMLETFKLIYEYSRQDIPVTVYYAYKENDSSDTKNITSTGWETMLSAIIEAGFLISGTWPIRTEMANRTIASGANALASSIVLVCRKRPDSAPTTTRRGFVNTLKRELKPALQNLQASNIAPVDMAQSAIGPGMAVFSLFAAVLEADGTPMSVRSALQIINHELDLYFTDQDSELDRDSRFCVDLYTQYAFNDVKFGDADVLARAKNTSIERLRTLGIVYAEKGVVRLLARDEIEIDPFSRTKGHQSDGNIWLLTQQLARALELDGVVGVAKIVADYFTSEPEHAKALAYRLFTIAERKGWAGEAYAYNSLVIAWPEILSKVAELQAAGEGLEQMTMFDAK